MVAVAAALRAHAGSPSGPLPMLGEGWLAAAAFLLERVSSVLWHLGSPTGFLSAVLYLCELYGICALGRGAFALAFLSFCQARVPPSASTNHHTRASLVSDHTLITWVAN